MNKPLSLYRQLTITKTAVDNGGPYLRGSAWEYSSQKKRRLPATSVAAPCSTARARRSATSTVLLVAASMPPVDARPCSQNNQGLNKSSIDHQSAVINDKHRAVGGCINAPGRCQALRPASSSRLNIGQQFGVNSG